MFVRKEAALRVMRVLVAYYLIALHSQHTLADESIPSNHVQLGKIQFDSVARQKHTHIAVLVFYYY